MNEHAVVIAGGGPTGLMLAAELKLAGVDALIVERRATSDVDGSRAGGLHARSLEVLDQRGVAERFVSQGQQHPGVGYAQALLDLGDFPSRHSYVLALWQRDIERILSAWVLGDLGVAIQRECEVAGFTEHDSGVEVVLSDGDVRRADYLVGCDGGRSVVRKAAGIDFPGLEATTSWMIAEVEMADEPEVGMRNGGGIGPVDRAGGGNPYRVVLYGAYGDHPAEPTLDDLKSALAAEYGTDFGVHRPSWISRFTDMTRQAATYRDGRVLLAGDAAHVHPPQGGQGLNLGMQDAVNLGWKLAQVVHGTSDDTLLDTYTAERHPVGARVLHSTRAQVALGIPDARHQALRETVSELVSLDEPRRRIAGMISGLDVCYDLGGEHPLVGRRMPDLDLEADDGPVRVYTLLHQARPVLLNLASSGRFDLGRWTDRVRLVHARYAGVWELPVLGEVAAPPAVLIRPDGHVAWVGDLGDPRLPIALTTWFGA